MGLGPPFVIAQLLAPPPNIRGQAAFGSVHRGSPSAVGGIQHWPSHWSNSSEAHLSSLPPHPCWLSSLYPPPRLCDPAILLLGALPQPPPLFHAPVKNDQRPRDRERKALLPVWTQGINGGWGAGSPRQAGLEEQGAQAISPGSGSSHLFSLRLGFVVGPARSQRASGGSVSGCPSGRQPLLPTDSSVTIPAQSGQLSALATCGWKKQLHHESDNPDYYVWSGCWRMRPIHPAPQKASRQLWASDRKLMGKSWCKGLQGSFTCSANIYCAPTLGQAVT